MTTRYFLGTALFFAVAAASTANASPATLCAAPGGAGGCHASIQAAIDAASRGATIDIYPGTYSEVASDRAVAGIDGRHQFGLFIATDGLTLRGVDAAGNPVSSASRVKALITTNATNSFGPSGIFVQGDGVTLSGLEIGDNAAGLNKTIEVIGDAFALEHSDISNIQGSVYINDFRYDATSNISHVQSYRIEGNNFRDGVSIDLASGAGVSGPVEGRQIRGNSFTNSYYFPAISFNGAGTGVKWFTHPVGGAVIEGNDFVNTFKLGDDPEDRELLLRQGHIRARGAYDANQFDWNAYFTGNRFDKAFVTVTVSRPPEQLREFSYSVFDPDTCSSGTCTFANRRIGALLEGEEAIALAGTRTMVPN